MLRLTLLVARRLLSILPCAILLIALIDSGTPLLAKVLIVVFFAVTLWNPGAGLLATAAAAPLGAFAIAVDGVAHFRLTEAILLAFISAWLLRGQRAESKGHSVEGPRLPRYAWIAAWFFSVLTISLTFALCRQLLRYPDALRIDLDAVVFHYFSFGDPTGISDTARILEGFALTGATIELIRSRPSLARSLPVALALSTLAATVMSLLLSQGIGLQQVLKASLGYRFSAHVTDVNAAASQFAMILCLSLGFAIRERGGRRVFWILSALSCSAGMWMSRSFGAYAAAGLVVPFAFLWAATMSWPRSRRLSLIGSVFAVVLIVGLVRAVQIERDPTYRGAGLRQQFVMSSFRVIGTHPYLGIGPGRYFRDSPNFLTPQLAWIYGSENAHNNFLQVTTETGIIGFFVYATFFGGALALAFGALRRRSEWALLGATAGLVTFLGTCLVSHPMLVREVATVFFLQLGLAAALGASSLLNRDRGPANAGHYNLGSVRLQADRGGRYEKWIVLAGTLVFAVLPAWQLEKPLMPVHLEEVDGMYYEDEVAEGIPYRWTREYGSVFIDSSWKVIELPLRAPQRSALADNVVVDITVDGKMIQRAIVDDTWSSVTLTLPSPEPPLAFSRVNLMVNHPMRVSQFTPGSSDDRLVGVQVGPIALKRVDWEFVPLAEVQAKP